MEMSVSTTIKYAIIVIAVAVVAYLLIDLVLDHFVAFLAIGISAFVVWKFLINKLERQGE